MENSPLLDAPGPWYKRVCAFLYYDILYAIYIGVLVTFTEFFTSPPKADIEKIDKRTGQVAVITGGPRGLALGLLKRLVEMDYTIIMGRHVITYATLIPISYTTSVRNVEDGEARLSAFAFADSNSNISTSKIKILEMDLMSLNSIRKFAENVLKQTSRIDLLLCNAAIMNAPYELSRDGLESQFQVNFLSNFLLTHLLLDKLKKTAQLKEGPCQVIYTSSFVYKYGKFRPEEFEKPIVYSPYKFYYPSKLYPVMAMLHLQEQLDKEGAKVYCYAVHPGLVPTDLWQSAGGCLVGLGGRLLRPIFRSLENAADTILWPTLSPEYLNTGGLYMESGASIPICDHAKNKDSQFILYKKSLKLAGLSK